MSDIYTDTATGDTLTDCELDQRYREWLDADEYVTICGLTYAPSRALEAVDPIAYRVGFSDWLDAELCDGNLGETDDDD